MERSGKMTVYLERVKIISTNHGEYNPEFFGKVGVISLDEYNNNGSDWCRVYFTEGATLSTLIPKRLLRATDWKEEKGVYALSSEHALWKYVHKDKSLYPSKTSISIVWDIEDVREVDDSLTDEECMHVLQLIKNTHDATLGVNWDTIQEAINTRKTLDNQ